MKLFHPSNPNKSDHSKRFYARVEMAYTLVDFTAAFSFVIGSVLFFWPTWETLAIWFFVIGSVCFAVKPTLKLWREVKLAAMNDNEDLSEHL